MKSELNPSLNVTDYFRELDPEKPLGYKCYLWKIWVDLNGHLVGEVSQSHKDEDGNKETIYFVWNFSTQQMD